MTFHSQQDSRYSSTKMGETSRTILQDGCTDTCLGMVSDKDPNEVNTALTPRGGYTYVTDPQTKITYALVLWNNACKALGNLEFVYRYKKYNNKVALDAISKYGFVLAEVDFDGNEKTTGKHWVVLVGNKKLYDPWSLSLYPESTSKYKVYTGLAVIRRI